MSSLSICYSAQPSKQPGIGNSQNPISRINSAPNTTNTILTKQRRTPATKLVTLNGFLSRVCYHLAFLTFAKDSLASHRSNADNMVGVRCDRDNRYQPNRPLAVVFNLGNVSRWEKVWHANRSSLPAKILVHPNASYRCSDLEQV